MLRIFATFLKKGSAKNFQTGGILNNILRSTDEPPMYALHPRRKVLVKLFQKLAGLGSAHKTAFLFAKPFSLRLVCQRKSGVGS